MYSKRPLIITKMSDNTNMDCTIVVSVKMRDNTNMDCTIAVSVQCTIAKKVGFVG
jgi:hypothetical protein